MSGRSSDSEPAKITIMDAIFSIAAVPEVYWKYPQLEEFA